MNICLEYIYFGFPVFFNPVSISWKLMNKTREHWIHSWSISSHLFQHVCGDRRIMHVASDSAATQQTEQWQGESIACHCSVQRIGILFSMYVLVCTLCSYSCSCICVCVCVYACVHVCTCFLYWLDGLYIYIIIYVYIYIIMCVCVCVWISTDVFETMGMNIAYESMNACVYRSYKNSYLM